MKITVNINGVDYEYNVTDKNFKKMNGRKV